MAWDNSANAGNPTNAANLTLASNWTGGLVPDGTKIAVFNQSGVSENLRVFDAAGWHIKGIEIGSNAGDLEFDSDGGGSARFIYLGSSGIVSNSSHTVTFSVSTKVNLALEANTSFTANGTGALRVLSDGASFTLGGFNLTLNGTNTISSISQAMTGTGGSLTKSGTGTWTVNGANTYTGVTKIEQGTLSVSNIVVSGSSNLGNATSKVVLGGSSTQGILSYTGNSATYTRGFTVNAGGGEFDVTTGGQTVTLSTGGIDTSGLLTIGGAGNTTINSVISGTGGLAKSGSGTLTLAGSNTYSGNTSISGGVLAFSTNANLGGSGSVIFSGGTLRPTAALTTSRPTTLGLGGGTFDVGSGLELTWNGSITGAAGNNLTKIGAGTLTLGGTNTYSGDTNVNAGTLKLATAAALSPNTKLTVAPGAVFDSNGFSQTVTALSGSGNLSVGSGLTVQPASGTSSTFSGQLTGTGGFTMSGAGTLTLAASNNFTGPTVISAGTLIVGAAGALPSTTPVTLSSGATLDLGGFATTIGKLAGSGGTVALNGASLVVNQTDSSTFSGALSGTGTLEKQGNGLLELTGNQTSFTGSTQISGGQLKINGSLANSAVTLSGGVLSGNGTVGALTISSGGVLAPGNSPGTMNSSSTTWAGNGQFNFEINQATGGTAGGNPGWDILSVTGGLTISATSAVGDQFKISVISLNSDNLSGNAMAFTATQDYSFTLAKTTTGVSAFALDKFVIDTTGFTNPFSGSWSLALTNGGNDINLVYTASAIPEPATWAALLGGAVLAFATVRRRRGK